MNGILKNYKECRLSIVIAVIALGLLVLIHEGGHFLAARLCKVSVLKFSIGFGPRIFSFTKGETEYALSLIPLGGYVKMKGENPDQNEIHGDQDEFQSKKWYQRAFIAFAGPFANLIFAAFLFIIAFSIGKTYKDFAPIIDQVKAPYQQYFQVNDNVVSVNQHDVKTWSDIFKYIKLNQGNTFILQNDSLYREVSFSPESLQHLYENLLPKTSTIIGDVSSGLPAWKAGLKNGDRIVFIQGDSMSNWYQIRDKIKDSEGEVEMIVERDKKRLSISLIPEINPLEPETKIVGITQELPIEIKEKSSIFEAVKYGSITTVNFVAMNYYGLYKLVKNPGAFKNSVGGPVMVFSMTKETSEKGLADTINFIAAISILLMIMNLLPIPVLDGGHIMFCLFEGITGKSVSIRFQQYAQQLGFALLMMLMIYAFTNDFSKMVSRNRSVKSNQEILDKQ
jgi:regulator of sigma E protease